MVASGNPDLAGMEPDVVLARGVDEFVAAIERGLGRRGADDRERRMRLAAANTWESRASTLLGHVQARARLGAVNTGRSYHLRFRLRRLLFAAG